MEIGITGGEEDGVNNENVDNEKLYTSPEQVNIMALLGIPRIRYYLQCIHPIPLLHTNIAIHLTILLWSLGLVCTRTTKCNWTNVLNRRGIWKRAWGVSGRKRYTST